MKLALLLSLIFETALCSPGTVGVDIYRARQDHHGGRTTSGNALAYERFLAAGGDSNEVIPESLNNGFYAYFANMTIGSNNQLVNPMIDTGSSDLWLTSRSNPYCTQDANSDIDSDDQWDCTGFLFDPTTSKTYRNLSEPFDIKYADRTGAYGWLSQDTVNLGGATLPNATFAFANTANSSDAVFGVGYVGNEATTAVYENGTITGQYKNLPVLLKEDGYINSVAYSLYLNDADAQSGQVLFGGVDHAKYSGTLGLMPLVNTYYPVLNQTIEFMVKVSGVSVRTGENVCPLADFVVPALLDSGTSYAVLPPDLVDAMGASMGYTWPSLPNATWWQGSCSASFDFDNFELDFLGQKLLVPPQSLLDSLQDADNEYVLDDQGNRICILAINKAGPREDFVLGDVFQRNWYVVYDLDNYQVALAQSKLNETSESNVEPIVSTIPGATSVKNYNLAGFRSSIATHSLASSCLTKPTSASLSASKSLVPSSSVRASSSAVGSARIQNATVSATPSAASVVATSVNSGSAQSSSVQGSSFQSSSKSADPSVAAAVSGASKAGTSAVLAASNDAAGKAVSSGTGLVNYVTTVVSSFVTTCPSPTTFATNGQTYTVTDSAVLTITNCPCTLTHEASALPSKTGTEWSAPSSSGPSPSASATAESVGSAVTSFVTTCPTPTTFITNGQTYTVTESTVLTITNCACTLSQEKIATPSPAESALSTEPASPSTASHSTTGPASTGPASTGPVSTEPVFTEPVSTEPVSTEPVSSSAISTGPAENSATSPAENFVTSAVSNLASSLTGSLGPSSSMGPSAVTAASSPLSAPTLAPVSSAPALANSAHRLSAAFGLSAVVGALTLFFV